MTDHTSCKMYADELNATVYSSRIRAKAEIIHDELLASGFLPEKTKPAVSGPGRATLPEPSYSREHGGAHSTTPPSAATSSAKGFVWSKCKAPKKVTWLDQAPSEECATSSTSTPAGDGRVQLKAPDNEEEWQETEALSATRIQRKASLRRYEHLQNKPSREQRAARFTSDTLEALEASHDQHVLGTPPLQFANSARLQRSISSQRRPRPLSTLAVVDGDFGDSDCDDGDSETAEAPFMTDDESDAELEYEPRTPPSLVFSIPSVWDGHSPLSSHTRLDYSPPPKEKHISCDQAPLEPLPLPGLQSSFDTNKAEGSPRVWLYRTVRRRSRDGAGPSSGSLQRI